MHKTVLITLAMLSLPASVGATPLPPPDVGFPSLTVRSANVSHCEKGPAGDWTCRPADERAAPRETEALAARIEVLATRLDALAAEMTALRVRLDAQQRAAGAPAPVAPQLSNQDAVELERTLGFMETMVRRFFAMVGEMKEETSREGPSGPATP